MQRKATTKTPIGYARYAREFFDCAIAADETIGSRPGYEIIAPIPVMYLVGHSIELSLKAYLLHVGVPNRKVREFGHNLLECLVEAENHGLILTNQIDASERSAISALNKLYSSKQLNYIITGSKQFPVFGPIQSACKKLLDSICPLVGYK